MAAASGSLSEYVVRYLQLGYDLQSIRQSLLSSGYSIEQINAAIDYAYAQNSYGDATQNGQFTQGNYGNAQRTTSKVKISLNRMQIGVLVLVFLVLIGFAIAFFNLSSDPISQTPVYNTITNPSADTSLTGAGESSSSISTSSSSPSSLSEKYDSLLRGDGTTSSTGSISNNNNPNSVQVLQEVFDDENQRRLTRLEIDERVEKLSATKPDDASILCQQIQTSAGRFTCLSKVAIISLNPKYCAMIDDFAAKDSCYMNFPIKELGTVAICEFIQNQVKKNSCIELYAILDIYAQQEQKLAAANTSSHEVPIIVNTNVLPPSYKEYDEGITVFFD
jgi:hypothetical protein